MRTRGATLVASKVRSGVFSAALLGLGWLFWFATALPAWSDGLDTPVSPGTQPVPVPSPVAPPVLGKPIHVETPSAPPVGPANPLSQPGKQSNLLLQNPEQIALLNRLASSELSQWPKMLHERRSVVNRAFIDNMVGRSNAAFALIAPNSKDQSAVHDAVDQSYRYSVIADLASREIGLPVVNRVNLASCYASAHFDYMALSIAREILVEDRDNLEAHRIAAAQELRDGDLLAALRDFEAVNKFDPRDDGAWANVGQIYLTMGNVQKGRPAVRRALDVNPSNKQARALLDQLDHPAQIAPPGGQGVIVRGSLTPPGTDATVGANVAAGRAALKDGALDLAEAGFREAVAQDPCCRGGYQGLGDVAFRRGDFYKAIDFYGLAVEYGPRDEEALYCMAVACEVVFDRTGSVAHLDRALECLRRAIQLRGNFPAARAAQERVLLKRTRGTKS